MRGQTWGMSKTRWEIEAQLEENLGWVVEIYKSVSGFSCIPSLPEISTNVHCRSTSGHAMERLAEGITSVSPRISACRVISKHEAKPDFVDFAK